MIRVTKNREVKVVKYVNGKVEFNCTGCILDDFGGPVQNAIVRSESTSERKFTDIDGCYSINVLDGEELIVSKLGYVERRGRIRKEYPSYTPKLKKVNKN